MQKQKNVQKSIQNSVPYRIGSSLISALWNPNLYDRIDQSERPDDVCYERYRDRVEMTDNDINISYLAMKIDQNSNMLRCFGGRKTFISDYCHIGYFKNKYRVIMFDTLVGKFKTRSEAIECTIKIIKLIGEFDMHFALVGTTRGY